MERKLSFIEQVTLTEFRSYEHLRIEADRRPVILTGPNGVGKTNFLEALSLLSPGRGLRRASLDNMRKKDSSSQEWGVAATIRTGDLLTHVGTGYRPSSRNRLIKIDHDTLVRQSDLASYISMVWLTPQMDRLFLEGSAARRRFLDRLVFAVDPAHAGRLSRYEKNLRERLHLLQHRTADPTWLNILEEKLAQDSVSIAASRCDMVRRLSVLIERAKHMFPYPLLKIIGFVEQSLVKNPALTVEENLQEMFRKNRAQDVEANQTTYGVHRSDLEVVYAEKNQPAAHCSTGEQKALLISLILAHARLLLEEQGRPPILLLDEVTAHLDDSRRFALFDEILSLQCQSWITGTDGFLFQHLGNKVLCYTLKAGGVVTS